MTRMLTILTVLALAACAPTRAEREAKWTADCAAQGFTGQTQRLCVMQLASEQRLRSRQAFSEWSNTMEHWQTRDALAPAYVPLHRR